MNFEPEMFRAYGTSGLVVEIPIRHMNVTVKDNALIGETIRGDILCRLPLGNGQKGDDDRRPRYNVKQGFGLFSDETVQSFKKVVT